jgi:iron complex outermembrane receptor protein
VAEVLRLVPGFLFTRRNGANPLAAYHSSLDLYGARMQVYVDGRSVYSSFYLGDTHRGLQGIVLEDIERIEVLRGSNSAAYGADAFLGVVNIVTQHAADTHGGMVSISSGDKGIDDNVARVGWGNKGAHFRLTASLRKDRGLDRVNDDTRLSQVHFRADLSPGPQDELRIHAGSMEGGFGEGLAPAAANPGNIERTVGWKDFYANVNWRRELAAGEAIEAHLSYEKDSYADAFPYANAPTIKIDYGGQGSRIEAGFQHTLKPAERSRLVWGVEWRRETAYSPPFFYSTETFSANRVRTFANMEWRPHAQWVFNVGGLYENHNIIGGSFAPRLMANFHALPDHTLRAGVTQSSRAPGLYELRGDTRFYNGNVLALWTFRGSGKVKAETLISHEIGYFGRLRSLGLTVDARGFVERMNNRVRFFGTPKDAINTPGPHIHGFEYQFDWKPFATTRILLSEAHLRSTSGRPDEAIEAPHRTTTLAWFQKLPGDLDFSLISHATTPFSWEGTSNVLDTPRQLDARLAWGFRVGPTRGEAAFTVQAINGGHQEYLRAYRFDRRAFATLRLDF